jgi:hypothetical protein
VQRVEETISWTWRERFRLLWYRLRLTVSEMNYATRRMLELQMHCHEAGTAPVPFTPESGRHP